MENILIVDDEPYHLRWLIETFEDRGYESVIARNVTDAREKILAGAFRMMVVDLNIPVFGTDLDDVLRAGEIYKSFPGLYVAKIARNSNYRGRQVVLYSAHKDAVIQAEAKKLGVEYITKGATRSVLKEIEDVLSYDPSRDP